MATPSPPSFSTAPLLLHSSSHTGLLRADAVCVMRPAYGFAQTLCAEKVSTRQPPKSPPVETYHPTVPVSASISLAIPFLGSRLKCLLSLLGAHSLSASLLGLSTSEHVSVW